MYSVSQVLTVLNCYPLAAGVDSLGSSVVRVSTQLKYPDGSNIDVFIELPAGELDFQQAKISDLGATQDWLFGAGVRAMQTARRLNYIRDVVGTLGILHEDGELFTWVGSLEQLPDALMRVAQASLRVSDLLLTQRFLKGTDFQEKFLEFLEVIHLPYAERVAVQTPNREVIFPYQVTGKTVQSWIQLLGSPSPQAAHSSALEIFTRWSDAEGIKPETQRVTIYDDQYDTYRSPDVQRFEKHSQLIPWSDQSTIEETLKR